MSGARRVAGPLAAGAAVAVYAAALRAYGIFDFADEGVLLAQAWRAAHGQVPYVDFATGYGPLYFGVQARLVAAGGLAAVRWGLVTAHGLGAALLYALARRLVGPALAAVAVVLEVAFFLPVAPLQGAPFNVPYPAWYTAAAALGAVVLLGSRRSSGAFLAGALAGAAFAMKPNSGLFLVAGGAAAIVAGRGEWGRAGLVGLGVLVLVVAGAVGLVAPMGLTVAAWVLVPPTVGLVALGTEHGVSDREALPRLAVLAAGFLLIAIPCYARPFLLLGGPRFTREALLIGAGVAEIYARPLGWPAAVAAAIGLLAFLVQGRWGERLLLAGGAGTLVLAFLGGAAGAAGPAALRRGAEEAAFALVPLALWGGLGALRGGQAALAAPTAIAVTAALQLYPRPDFLHLMPVAPLLLPLTLHLWRAGVALVPLPARMVPAVLVGLPLGVAAVRLAPTALVAADVLRGRVAEVAVGDARLVVEPAGAERLRALASAVATVGELTNPDEAVVAFPACSIVPFFAARRPAGPHDYFYPGRPDRGEAAVLAVRLGAAPPRIAVTCAAAGTDLARAWEYYPEFTGLIAARYRPLRVLPPFIVYEARR